MTHYISIGINKITKELKKITLDEFVDCFSVPDNCDFYKETSMIILPAYNSTLDSYPREQNGSDKTSTIFIDYDNDKSNPNMNAIEEFKEAMKDYEYWIYETHSSMSKEKPYPKFRAIIPLDESIKWGDTTKSAITYLFKKWQDTAATWFFAPTHNKAHTLEHHEGKPYPSINIKMKIASFELDEQMRMNDIMLAKRKREAYGWNDSMRKDFHDLPLVQEYLSSVKGFRNSSAHKAACSMFSRGYDELDIKNMLREGPIDRGEINSVFNSAKSCKR